jgi:hypothetical protein
MKEAIAICSAIASFTIIKMFQQIHLIEMFMTANPKAQGYFLSANS